MRCIHSSIPKSSCNLNPMKIAAKVVVKLKYTLSLDDGSLAAESAETEPFEFIYGLGHNLPAFEKNILGLEEGGEFSFSLGPEEAFGEIDENLIVKLPEETFSDAPEGAVELHKSLPMLDSEGNTIFGVVSDIEAGFITMDFNHPLAGETLHFEGRVLNVRKARPSELEVGRSDIFPDSGDSLN